MHLRRITGAVFTLGFSAFIAAGCGSSGIPASAICTVYGGSVAKSEYNAIVGQALQNLKTSGQKAPKKGSTQYTQLQNQAVDYLIEQKLFEQQAAQKGINITNKQVDSRLKTLVQSYFKGSQTAYKAELKKQGITEDTVKQRIKEQLISEQLFNKVTKGVTVSDADAKKNYDQNPDQYQQKESRTVAHILVKTQALANTIYAQVKSGNVKTFAKLAAKYSQDPSSAKNGGVLTITQGETVPQFDAVAFALKTGQVHPPVHTQYGWHVITARTAITPAKQQSFNSVKAQIKSTLSQSQRSRVMQDFQTTLRKKAQSHVSCRKGYTWTQTVTATTATSATPATPPTSSSTPTTSSSTSNKKKTSTTSKKK